MTAIHRREMLGIMLGGAVVATAGLALMPVPAESAPLGMQCLPRDTEATRLTSSTREPENFSLRPRQWRCARILLKVRWE